MTERVWIELIGLMAIFVPAVAAAVNSALARSNSRMNSEKIDAIETSLAAHRECEVELYRMQRLLEFQESELTRLRGVNKGLTTMVEWVKKQPGCEGCVEGFVERRLGQQS